jgi:glutathione-regulated potassium-efflux system ancillary protein KefG
VKGPVLVLFAHPALERSRVHRRLLEALDGCPGSTVHDLYETYPDFDVDVRREQQQLAAHETIVLQHPLFWYSSPALVKQWLDLVLEHGWAYGSGGTALAGKTILAAVSSGGRESAYRAEGFNGRSVREFLAPLEQTARLCGMDWLAPFVVHGTHAMGPPAIERAASDYRRVIEALRDGRIDRAAARAAPFLNADLGAVLGA